MNKMINNLIATLVFALLLSFVLPWWSIMVAAFSAALLIPLDKTAVFFSPFLAIFLYWSVYCYLLSSANAFLLAEKIAQVLPLGSNPYLLIVVTGAIGGMAAGVSGIVGKELRGMISNN